jgi:hypothetical protein
MWLQLLINIGIYAFKEYAKNSDSKHDDKILEVVQIGAKYLQPKANNTMTEFDSNVLSCVKMKQTQRAR